MTSTPLYGIGAFQGLTGRREFVHWHDVLAAYCGMDARVEPASEAYLSHFAYGREMAEHFDANHHSVRGFDGPVGGGWLVLDVDRSDPAVALADAGKLLTAVERRYPALDGRVPVFFSGRKGYHVYLDLAHRPPAGPSFHATCRALATTLAVEAGVTVDSSLYDKNRLVRLPNSRHRATGRYKVLLTDDEILRATPEAVAKKAELPFAFDMPRAYGPLPQLATDWEAAQLAVAQRSTAPSRGLSTLPGGNSEAPKYLHEFLRWNTEIGTRANTLFRCAAWCTEAGAPASFVRALLGEPGRDQGLTPSEVSRQIECGIAHAQQQAARLSSPHATEAP